MEKNHSAVAAFQVHAADNVATLLGDAVEGSPITIVGPAGKRDGRCRYRRKVLQIAMPSTCCAVVFAVTRQR